MSDKDEAGADRFADQEPIAHVFDDHPDTEDELIANVYTLEAAAELEEAWWTRVEWVDGEKPVTDGGVDQGDGEIEQVDIPVTVPPRMAENMVDDFKEKGWVTLRVTRDDAPDIADQIEWQLDNDQELLEFTKDYDA